MKWKIGVLAVFVLLIGGCVTVNIVKDVPKVSPSESEKGTSTKEDAGGKYSATQKTQTSKYETELQKGLDLLSRKQCKESIDHFSALTVKHPGKNKVQYYLALAYDECGYVSEALREYEEYVNMQPGNNVFARKSKSRIHKLKDEIAKELINEANMLAGGHKYEDCLEKLEQAYALRPSTVMANKIREEDERHKIGSIAWKMSSNSDSLREKTVSIVPFVGLSKEKNIKGNYVAGVLKTELTNLQKLEVYVRDDDSIRAILKELEFGQTGAIDEKTRKELGKLVSTGAIIAGQVGYIAETFKINGWMINVESGRIVSSESVSVLGYNIEDTDKFADFNIEVWMDKKEYRIGELVTINIKTSRDCFVTLKNVRSNGKIWELFPNRYNANNFMKANVRHTIPAINDNFGLTIVDPPGREYIKAIATSVPITEYQITQILSKDTSNLVASADIIGRGSDSAFRSVSPSEMRGLHEILTRGVGSFPVLEGDPEYKQVGYCEPGTQFESAVSTWSFVTRRESSNVGIKSAQPIPEEKSVDRVNILTKKEVLQRLGKPDTTGGWAATERWFYGTSYVEFENGIFTRCYEPHGRDDLKRKLGK